MPATTRASRVCSGASTREYNKKASYPRYATGNTMKNPAYSGNARKQLKDERVQDRRAELKYSEVAGWKVNLNNLFLN